MRFGGDRLGHAELLRAEREHRGVGLREVEAPAIDLTNVGQELGAAAAVFVEQLRQITEETLLGEHSERGEVGHESDATTGVFHEASGR